MTFLAPALLAGLLAVAIPIVVHLVQRERRTVQAFPSLMFLKRIPNQSVRRRAIRHWPLLALRILALVLIALAFARPILRASGAAGGAAGGARHVVVLLDRSASMGYGEHWRRAQDAARDVVRGLGAGDGGSVVLFANDVEVAAKSETGPGTLMAAIDRARPGPGSTRIGPALRAAAGLLEPIQVSRREIVLVSDFQRSGWDANQDVKLPAGVTLRTVSVAEQSYSNTAIVGVAFGQESGPKGAVVRAEARVANFGARPVAGREMTLDVDGHRVETTRVSIEPGATTTVAFAPFVVSGRGARVTARLTPDALAADDVFHAVVTIGGQVPVLVLEGANAAPDASLYLARSLEVAAAPGFATRIVRSDRVTPQEIDAASVIVLDDTRPPAGAAARALASAVNAGAGLLVLMGERSAWTDSDPDLLPGKPGTAVDRTSTGGGTLGYVDLTHPAFEIFSSPRSGDLAAARIFRYRTLATPARVLARFDDGAAAIAERKVGRGGVIAWMSTLDGTWNDLPLKPVFVPLVHQLMRHLGRYVEPRSWYSVGEMYDPAEAPSSGASRRAADARALTVVSPSGAAIPMRPGEGPRTVGLSETGFYEVRPAASGSETTTVAVNGVPAESDLAVTDAAELKARVTKTPGEANAAAGHEIGIDELERRQSLWWFLLGAGLLLLIIEAVVASRLPRIAS